MGEDAAQPATQVADTIAEAAKHVSSNLTWQAFVREIFNPKGAWIITKIHKVAHPFFLLHGEMSIVTEDGVKRIKAPYHGMTPAGTKRLIFVHEDVVFVTVHATKETDLDKIFTPNYEISTVIANILQTDHYEKPNQNISQLITSVRSSEERLILVAPARGKISEGIEFVKNDKSLISAVMIAGLPYPPPSRSLKEIIKEYSKFWGEERAVNYMNYLQGIVTMRQCLGRMIRSENDIGAWIILDNRINHMNIFPRAIECKNIEKMKERLRYFYDLHSFD